MIIGVEYNTDTQIKFMNEVDVYEFFKFHLFVIHFFLYVWYIYSTKHHLTIFYSEKKHYFICCK